VPCDCLSTWLRRPQLDCDFLLPVRNCFGGKRYFVLLVHYFDGTDVKVADKESIRKNFLRWGKTASDAIDFATKRANVLSERIGLLGTSRGASLALSLAAVRPGISAIVEFSGVLPAPVKELVKLFPPTLIIHGGQDRIVAVDEAY